MEQNNETIFILGAGASVHRGFLTGKELIDNISKVLQKYLFLQCIVPDHFSLSYYKGLRDFRELLLKERPQSIDNFLTKYSHNKNIINTGKSLICQVLSHCQAFPGYLNRTGYIIPSYKLKPSDNWYELFYEKIISTSENSKTDFPQIKIFTFNYDLSLEFFFETLISNDKRFDERVKNILIETFMSRIVHIYGSIYKYMDADKTIGANFCGSDALERYRAVWRYSRVGMTSSFHESTFLKNNIKVIGEDRSSDDKIFLDIKKSISNATRIFILGFGFDTQNIKLIGLDKLSDNKNLKAIYYTNYMGDTKIHHITKNLFGNLPVRIKSSEKVVFEALYSDFNFRFL